jgi:integrase
MNRLTAAAVNEKNLRLKEDFLNYLASGGKSEGAMTGYANDLDIFFNWNALKNGDKFFPEVTKLNFLAFQSFRLGVCGNSPARMKRLKSALKSLSAYIETFLDETPGFENFRTLVDKIPDPPKRAVRKKTVLTDAQLNGLLRDLLAEGDAEKACLLALAMYSGRRKSELLRFRVLDFAPERLICGGALYKTAAEIRTKGFGQGKFMHLYTLATPFQPYFDAWTAKRSALGMASEWLFPSRRDPKKQLSISTLNQWALLFGERLGVDFYHHAVRHYTASQLSRAGFSDAAITALIGWESSDILKIYLDISKDETLEQHFGGGKIDVK